MKKRSGGEEKKGQTDGSNRSAQARDVIQVAMATVRSIPSSSPHPLLLILLHFYVCTRFFSLQLLRLTLRGSAVDGTRAVPANPEAGNVSRDPASRALRRPSPKNHVTFNTALSCLRWLVGSTALRRKMQMDRRVGSAIINRRGETEEDNGNEKK